MGVLGIALVLAVVRPHIGIVHLDIPIGNGGVALQDITEIHLFLIVEEFALALERVRRETGLDEAIELLAHALLADDPGIACILRLSGGIREHGAEGLLPVLLLFLGNLSTVEGAGDPRRHIVTVADVIELVLREPESERIEVVAIQAFGQDVTPDLIPGGIVIGVGKEILALLNLGTVLQEGDVTSVDGARSLTAGVVPEQGDHGVIGDKETQHTQSDEGQEQGLAVADAFDHAHGGRIFVVREDTQSLRYGVSPPRALFSIPRSGQCGHHPRG